MARKMRWEDIDADVSASGAASAPASLKTEVERDGGRELDLDRRLRGRLERGIAAE